MMITKAYRWWLLVAPLCWLSGAGCREPVTMSEDGPSPEATGLTVRITAPASGAVLSGMVSVTATPSAAVSKIEFYVDDARKAEVGGAPYEYLWDTTAHENPVPPPNHPLRFGYYYADGRYGDHTAEVNGYTDLYVALPRGYLTDLDWRPLFRQSLANAASSNRQIYLELDDETIWDDVLSIAAPHWARVQLIELADEPSWSGAQTEGIITRLKAKLGVLGLAVRPIGVVYTRNQVLTSDAILARGLNWVGIEGYVDPPGSPSPEANRDALTSYVAQAKARVPADKQIVLVMMAYDRNGAWKNIQTLVDLQLPTYLLAGNDPRVLALTLFSYARPGGTRDHPELKVSHQQMAEKILGRAIPSLANGRRTLRVVASDASGRSATDQVQVSVEN